MSNTAEQITEIYMDTIRAMTLCTCLAHEKAEEMPKVRRHIQVHMALWLRDYEPNPLMDVDRFFRKAVIECRDEVEKFMGVHPSQFNV